MPEGEGGEARGRLSCSRVIPLWWLKDPMVLSHSLGMWERILARGPSRKRLSGGKRKKEATPREG